MKKIILGILAIPALAFLAPFAFLIGIAIYALLYAFFFAGAVAIVIMFLWLIGY